MSTVNVIDVLEHDHRAVEALFSQIEALSASTDETSAARRRALVEEVTVALVTHSVAEEVAVYPRIADVVGKAEADLLRTEQAETEKLLKALEKLNPESTGYTDAVSELIKDVREHVREEEAKAFPQFRTALSEKELVDLGDAVVKIKTIAPTHPHPLAPNSAAGHLLLGPAAGLFDRLRDAVSHRGAA